MFDDLLEKNIDEPMNEYDKLSFNIDHVKHVGEIVTLLRYMISKNDLLLLEVKDMIDFLKKKRVNWTRVC